MPEAIQNRRGSMSRNVFRLLSVVLGAGLFAGAPALADQFSYELGRQLGQQTTRSAWVSISRRRGCDAADDLVAVITRSARRIGQTAKQYGKRDMVDYAEGYIHGLRSTLRDVAIECTDKCGAIGEVAGTASAIVFCEVANLIGEVPIFIHQQDMPNITCGEPYRIQCEITFENTTQHDCASFAGGGQAQQAQYAAYYQADKGGACSYNPPRPH
jgi:hypothetical protein